MKNLYIKKQQKDKNKLYTRFSRYCQKNSKDLEPLLTEYLCKMEVPINFDKLWYDSLDREQKSFYGDCVDSLLSGGSYEKVNGYRAYFHQPWIMPSEIMKQHVKDLDDELVRFIQHYNFTYPRWKIIYYPDGHYRTHLDLVVNNLWHEDEAFDITINETNDMLLGKLVELISLCVHSDFAFVNVLNLYNGIWYSYKLHSNPELENKCADLFKSFVELRKKEEEENSNE